MPLILPSWCFLAATVQEKLISRALIASQMVKAQQMARHCLHDDDEQPQPSRPSARPTRLLWLLPPGRACPSTSLLYLSSQQRSSGLPLLPAIRAVQPISSQRREKKENIDPEVWHSARVLRITHPTATVVLHPLLLSCCASLLTFSAFLVSQSSRIDVSLCAREEADNICRGPGIALTRCVWGTS